MALTDSLISYWAIDEDSGTRVDKVTATGNDLNDNNTVGQTTGHVYPNAGAFAVASSRYLSRADNDSLRFGGTAFTWLLWIQIAAASGDQIIVGKDDVGTNREYIINYDTGLAQFSCSTWTGSGGAGRVDLAASSFGTPIINTWYMLMVKSDQTLNYISVNNGTVNTVSAVNAGWAGAAPFNIGARNSGALPWGGKIGPVAFWKRAVPAAEITQIWNGGSGMTHAAMVAASASGLVGVSSIGSRSIAQQATYGFAS